MDKMFKVEPSKSTRLAREENVLRVEIVPRVVHGHPEVTADEALRVAAVATEAAVMVAAVVVTVDDARREISVSAEAVAVAVTPVDTAVRRGKKCPPIPTMIAAAKTSTRAERWSAKSAANVRTTTTTGEPPGPCRVVA